MISSATIKPHIGKPSLRSSQVQGPYLVIHSRVGQNQQSRLAESVLKLICEGSRGMATSDSLCTCVLGKLQNSTLTIRPSRLDGDVRGVLNGNKHTGGHLQFIPGLAEVDDENTCHAKNMVSVNYLRCINHFYDPNVKKIPMYKERRFVIPLLLFL